jgi:predicted lipoprotein with Yx(FWY)xxD motif
MLTVPLTRTARHRRPVVLAALAAAGVLALAGCGGIGADASAAVPPITARGPLSLQVASGPLGRVAVDSAGRTVYRFDKDPADGSSSACQDACATAWPAVTVEGRPRGSSGVTGTLGLLTRPDGTHQVTLDGHPLYRFVADRNAGDANGDGVGGTWHVVPMAPEPPPSSPRNATNY